MHRIASQMLQLSRRKAETVKQILEKADRPRAVCATKTPMGWLALADQMLHRGHDGDVRVVLFRWSFENDQLSVRHESRDELLRARKARVLLDVCDEGSRVALLPNSVVLLHPLVHAWRHLLTWGHDERIKLTGAMSESLCAPALLKASLPHA